MVTALGPGRDPLHPHVQGRHAAPEDGDLPGDSLELMAYQWAGCVHPKAPAFLSLHIRPTLVTSSLSDICCIKYAAFAYGYTSLTVHNSLISCRPVLLLKPLFTTPAYFLAPRSWWQHQGFSHALTGGPLGVGVWRADSDVHSQGAGGQHHSCNEIMFPAFYILQSGTENIIIVFVHSK